MHVKHSLPEVLVGQGTAATWSWYKQYHGHGTAAAAAAAVS